MRRTSLLLLFTFSITEAFLPSTLTHSLVHQANDKLSKKRSGVNHPTMAMSASDIVSVATLLPNIQDLVPPEVVSQPNWAAGIGREEAEALAGPFFGASLLPYLAFLYFLDVKENKTPKGITVGFATCLLFVFLTIPAAIGAQVWYGVSLADSDWLHGSAESLLTITNLVTVVAFRQALSAGESGLIGEGFSVDNGAVEKTIPPSITSYEPMIKLVIVSTTIAAITAIIPAVLGAGVHTPYLNGFMDLPKDLVTFGYSEPENALTIATWIIHISSLVEFLVAMGFAWRWSEISGNEKWKGLTWGLIPLHSSGITACTYHLFFNRIPLMVPFQAFLTCVGNSTAAYAAYRIAISNGWKSPIAQLNFLSPSSMIKTAPKIVDSRRNDIENKSLFGFEDLGDVLSEDDDYTFLMKLFIGCAIASYVIKYGELFFGTFFEANLYVGFSFILIPTLLNCLKWYKRSSDPNFEGWF